MEESLLQTLPSKEQIQTFPLFQNLPQTQIQVIHSLEQCHALEAELNYVFGKQGCVPAYNSIVGGGANACILHYVENNQVLKELFLQYSSLYYLL